LRRVCRPTTAVTDRAAAAAGFTGAAAGGGLPGALARRPWRVAGAADP